MNVYMSLAQALCHPSPQNSGDTHIRVGLTHLFDQSRHESVARELRHGGVVLELIHGRVVVEVADVAVSPVVREELRGARRTHSFLAEQPVVPDWEIVHQ